MTGPMILTASNRAFNFWPINLDAFDIGDIARSLSNICRFNGHLPRGKFYSVAEHSVIVTAQYARKLNERKGLADNVQYLDKLRTALLHDASEAYMSDLPGPMKHGFIGEYQGEVPLLLDGRSGRTPAQQYEEHLMEALTLRFSLNSDALTEIGYVDKFEVYPAESYYFGRPDGRDIDLEIGIQCLSPTEAEDAFLSTYLKLEDL